MVETATLKLTEEDVWALQASIKHDMLVKLENCDECCAGQTLREKVNSLIIEFAETHEHSMEGVDVALTAEELWLIDKQLVLNYANARGLLVRVFKALITLDTAPLWGATSG